MLLMTLDNTRRVSDQELSLEHSWYGEVSSAPIIKRASSKLYGGQVAPTYGGFSLIPGVGSTSMDVVGQWTGTTESDAVEIFRGKAYEESFDREGVKYELRPQDYSSTVEDVTFSGTLTSIFTTYCGASYLNRTLDISNARSSSPIVNYTISGEKDTAEVLSDIAAFFCHAWWDDGDTIYLYDCLADNGAIEFTEFDFAAVTYTNTPYAAFTAGEESVAGTYASASNSLSVNPVCHETSSNIIAALGNIKTLIEMKGASLPLVMSEKAMSIVPGMRISWTDETTGVTAWIRAQSINYDFSSKIITVEGKGSVA